MEQRTKIVLTEIGSRIRDLRLAKGWSQAELADRVGYSDYRLISLIENGRRDLRISTLTRIAVALETGPTDLILQIGLDRLPKLDEDLLALLRRAGRLPKKSATRLRRIVKSYLTDDPD